jgi:hypothetical protein
MGGMGELIGTSWFMASDSRCQLDQGDKIYRSLILV